VIGRESNGLYFLPAPKQIKESTTHSQSHNAQDNTNSANSSVLLWHQRLGHTSSSVLAHVIPFSSKHSLVEIQDCTICPLAKQHRLPFPHSTSVSSSPFQLLHIDVWGPFKFPTYDGNRFFVTIVDDCTRMLWLFLIKLKSDVFVILQNFCKWVHNQFDVLVKAIRTDNGT